MLLFIACGGPRVNVSFLAPEAYAIDSWALISEPEEQPTDSSESPGLQIAQSMTASKYRSAEEKELYLKQLSDEMFLQDLLIYQDSLKSGGIIIAYLEGGRKLFEAKSHYGSISELVRAKRGDKRMGDHEDNAKDLDYYNAEAKAVDDDKVRFARFRFFSRDNKMLGVVTIQGEEIKPEFISKVISRYLKDGKY